ncbi:MAG: two-component system, NtrC family, sensor kinase [Actinomycetota bacterium]|jgi:signal transduction histidine kinase|nr:two-component system, NtrC family, sensor kinase [Actinomycetota bacterium]
MARKVRFVDVYVLLVSLAGAAVFVWAGTARPGLADAASARGFWLFALLLAIGEVFPIAIPRQGGEVEYLTASTTFAIATLIAYGPAAAIVVQVTASVLADIIQRKSAWKVAFNVGQYALSLGAAGLVYRATGGTAAIHASSLPAFLAAGFVFFVANVTLTDIVLGSATGQSLLQFIGNDMLFQAQAVLPLLALSPVVIAILDESLWFVPLVVAPEVAVWWGTHLALENARLAEQLQGSLEQMTELARAKDDFVAVVSHELRTPLTSIQGYVKTMLQLAGDLPEDQRKTFLEAADRQSDRLRHMIEQLLVVARLESDVEPVELSLVSIPRLASDVVDELRPQAHGHVFDLRSPSDLPSIQTDEAKVHQILSNLVENALKYAPPDTRISLHAEPGVRGIVISVSDEGPGIPEESRDRIFERFYQVDQSATRRVGGTGLGLYICTKMADAIGARLWLARSADAGSEFALFLPERPPGYEEPAKVLSR